MRRLVPGFFLLMVLLVGTILVAQEEPVAAADDWLGWAGTAWKYFAPSPTGNVNSVTGLNRATQWWGFFTDWDLASYVVAILHAKDLELISETGPWGASYRLDKVLTFLEDRPLRLSDGLPWWCYKWDEPYKNPPDPTCTGGSFFGASGPGDAGFFLVALYLVKEKYPLLAGRVDAIVDHVRAAYIADYYDSQGRLRVSYDFYTYVGITGFENFGFPVAASKQALEEALARSHVDVYGQNLARVPTTAEPFLIGLLDLPMDWTFQDYAYRTYKAMEGRFNDPTIGILTAWSECARDTDPNYVYEWVVNAAGGTWQLKPLTDSKGKPYTPVVTSKAVFGYYALYRTPYTQNLIAKVLPKIQTSIGFTEGTNEATGGNVGDGLQVATDKTNSLIISAARYAIGHPVITILTPISGFLGTVVSIAGSGFVAGDTNCTISSSPTDLISNAVCVAVAGAVSGSFTVVSNTTGQYTVTVTGNTGDFAQAQFQVVQVVTSFYTNPTRFVESPGSITLDGTAYTNGQSGIYTAGTYSTTANAPTDYQFYDWEWSGDVSCSSNSKNPANCTVSSTGSLKAIFAAKVTFHTDPSTIGSISWGSCSNPPHGNGESFYAHSLPPEYSNNSITSCYVPSGYTFDSWSCSGGLACSASSNPTVVTFTGPGAITLNLKTGSLPNPVGSSLTASASPLSPSPGAAFTVSGNLTANAAGLGGEQILLVFGNGNVVAVPTQLDGSYSYSGTAPVQAGVFDVEVFFLGDYGGGTQYLPSTATVTVSVS